MDALKRLERALALAVALTAAASAFAQSQSPDYAASADPTESLMLMIGTLKAPLPIAMNCPIPVKDKNSYISQLARHNHDPESIAALVNGSVALLPRIEAAIDRGEENDAETAESFQPETGRLIQLASSVQKSGGLDFDGLKFGYRSDSVEAQMLSSISNLYGQRIPAYARAARLDPAAADALKITLVNARLSELTQGHPDAANEDLRRDAGEEVKDGELAWTALKKVIAVGLDHLTPDDGPAANFTLRNPESQKRSEQATHKKSDNGNYRPGYLPSPQSAKRERSRELQELEATQVNLARILADEDRQLAATKH